MDGYIIDKGQLSLIVQFEYIEKKIIEIENHHFVDTL